MKSFFTIFLAILLVEIADAQSGEDFLIENWTTDNGLPQNTITDIYQTENGYLWLSTYEGLVRFDGKQFVVFNPATVPGMKCSRLIKIIPFGKNSILVLSEEGHWILLNESGFINFNTEEKVIDYIITQKMPGVKNKSDYFIFLTNRNIKCIDQAVFKKYNLKMTSRIMLAHESENGRLWFLLDDGCLYCLNNGVISINNIPGSNKKVFSMIEDKKGNLWGSTIGSGLFCYNKSNWKMLGKNEGYLNDNITTISEDSKGILWFGTDLSGLKMFHDGTLISVLKKNGLPDTYIRKIYFDREGNIWLGTNVGGLLCLKEKRIRTLSMEDGLAFNLVLSIHEDKEDRIWVGTNGNGFSCYKDGIFKNYYPNNVVSKYIWSINSDSKGTKWFSSYGVGLMYSKDGKYYLSNLISNLEHSWIRVIFEDSRKNLWFGTERNGLFCLKNDKIQNITTENGLSSNFIISMLEDKGGTLWIGTNGGGVSSFQHNKFTNYNSNEGLSNNVVRAIYEDKFGVLWFGTYGGGLNRFKDGRFVSITKNDGLYDNVIHNIIEDDEGNFWMSCNKGIFVAKRQELNDFADGSLKYINCYGYGKSDGMRSDECNGGFQPSVCKTHDNKLWYPTIDGIAVVDLNKVTKNNIIPPVVIEKIIADNDQYLKFDDLQIPPGKKTFEFQYTCLSFREPRKIRFKYKLEGFENDWVEAGNRRSAYYTNISPGEYEFRVIACNDDGVWNTEGARVRFIVRPFFYQTLAFYIASSFIGLFIIFVVFQHRVRKLRKNQIVLEKIIDDRTSELRVSNATKDKLFSIIAHDLRNQIGNFMNVMQAITDDNSFISEKQSKEFLKRLSLSSEKTYELLENLLNWAANQQGTIAFEPERIEINALVLEVISLLANNAFTKSIKLSFDMEENIFAFCDKNMVLTVLRNLTANAIKFSKQGGEIKIFVEEVKPWVQIIIKDEGIGISEDNILKLFNMDQNFTTKGTAGERGTGLGLILCREFIEKNGGRIWVKSKIGEGSRFIFTLPLSG